MKKRLAVLVLSMMMTISMNAHANEVGEDIQPVLIMAPLMNQAFDGIEMMYLDETIGVDVAPQVIDGKLMVPLRAVGEALGYEVGWDQETFRVELTKGSQWTSVTIGDNAYFRNRMAPAPLSSEPVIVDSRTLVPVEFITEILQHGIEVDEAWKMKIYDEPFTTLTGYIGSVEAADGYTKLYISPREGEVELWEQTVLIVTDRTIINRPPYEAGDFIHGVHLPVMTMSIPGQTGAVIIY